MGNSKKRKLPKRVSTFYERLNKCGGLICRQTASTQEAITLGHGFLYFEGRTGAAPSTLYATHFIDEGLCTPYNDGLFTGMSQTFKLISIGEFEAYKSSYECAVEQVAA